jgi:toxin ParE1/3/4
MSGFVFHPEAAADLEELWEYIAADSLDSADRVLDEIYEVVHSAVQFPEMGFNRPELTSKPLRFLSVRDYLIVYAPEERPLLVVAVLDGRRNPRVIAALLRERE